MFDDSDSFNKKSSISKGLKETIFITFHRVLSDIKMPAGISQLLILFQFIQLMAMIFNEDNPLLIGVVSEDILKYCKIPLVYPYIIGASTTVYIILLAGIAIFILIIILGFNKIGNLPETEHRKYGSLKQLYGFTLNAIDIVLLQPVLGILLSSYLCGPDNYATCWGSTNIVLIIFATIEIILFLGFVGCVGMFFFNFNFKQKDAQARSPAIMHFIFKLYQVIAIFLEVFQTVDKNSESIAEDQNSRMTALVFFHGTFSIVFAIDYYNRLPYYNQKVSEMYCFCVYAFFWINIVFFGGQISYQTAKIKDNIVWIILIGLIFWLRIVKTGREFFYRRLLIREIDEINNEIHQDVRFRYQMSIVKNAKKNKQDELLMTSIIKVHTESCTNIWCICKNRANLFDPKKKVKADINIPSFKDPVFVKNYQLTLIRDSAKKMTRSSQINIDYFLFLFEELHNIPLVNYHILLFEKQFQQNLFITVQYCIYRMRISMYYYQKNRNKNNLSSILQFEDIRKYDNGIKELKSKFNDIIESNSRMWDILNDSIPDLDLLKKICIKLTTLKSSTLEIYTKILEITKSCYKFLGLMNLYAKYIIFDELLANDVHQKIKINKCYNTSDSMQQNVKQYIKKINILNDDTCSIAISFNYENLGQITWTSTHCERIFEYDCNYLRTFNIAHVQPPLIGQHHNQFLDSFFNTGEGRLMNNMTHLWGINKSKQLFSLFMNLKMFLSKEGLSIQSFIQILDKDNYQILNEFGEINCFGKSWSALFGLEQFFFSKNNNCSILVYCPKLIPLFQPTFYSMEGFKIKDFDYKRLEELYIFIPRDNNKQMQSLSEKLSSAKAKYSNNQSIEFYKEYCKIMHVFLSLLDQSAVVKCHRVKIRIEKKSFRGKLKLYVLKQLNFDSIDIGKQKESRWKRQMCFTQKLLYNNAMTKSQQRYNNSLLGIVEEEIDNNTTPYKAAKLLMRGRGGNKEQGSDNLSSDPTLNKDKPKKKKFNAQFGSQFKNKNKSIMTSSLANLAKGIKSGVGKEGEGAPVVNEDGEKDAANTSTGLGVVQKKPGMLGGLGKFLGKPKEKPLTPEEPLEKTEEKTDLIGKTDTVEKVAAPKKGFGGMLGKAKIGQAKPADEPKQEPIPEPEVKAPAPVKKAGLGGMFGGKFGGMKGKVSAPPPNAETGNKDADLAQPNTPSNAEDGGSSSLPKKKGFGSFMKKPSVAKESAPTEEVKVGGALLNGFTGRMFNIMSNINQPKTEEPKMEFDVEVCPKEIAMSSESENEGEAEIIDYDNYAENQNNSSKEVHDSVHGSMQDKGMNVYIDKLANNKNDDNNEDEWKPAGQAHTIIVKQKDTLVKIKNNVSNQQAPITLRLAEWIFIISLLVCITVSIFNWQVFNSYFDQLKYFTDDLTTLSIVSNSMFKVANYMEYQNLITAPISISMPVITTEMNAFLTENVKQTHQNATNTFFAALESSLNGMGYEPIDKVFFWDTRHWVIKTQDMVQPLVSYYQNNYVAIGEYFDGVDVDTNEKITLENLQIYTNFIQQFYGTMIEESKKLSNKIMIQLIFDFQIRQQVMGLAICISIPLTFCATLKASEILILLTKVSMKHINFYMFHYSKLSMALKGDSISVNILYQNIQTNYQQDFIDNKKGQAQNGTTKTRLIKGVDNKKIDWILGAIAFFTIMFICQGGKLFLLVSTGSEVQNNLDYINSLPEVNFQIYSASTYGLRQMGLKINGQTGSMAYISGLEEYNKIYTNMTVSLDQQIRSENYVKDTTFDQQLEDLYTSDLCVTEFGIFLFI